MASTDDLGRLRVLCGQLGLDQATFSHLPPDEERQAMIDFAEGLGHGLDRRGMTLEMFEWVRRNSVPDPDGKIVSLSPRRRAR